MNHNSNHRTDATAWNAFGGDSESIERPGLSAFVVLPMSWAPGNICICQAPVNAQHALYLLACQQAEAVVRAVHRRRQRLFARGTHLWN
jgi:hypothetical protein